MILSKINKINGKFDKINVKMRKIYFVLIIILLFSMGAYYFIYLNKVDYISKKSDIVLSPNELINDFKKNENHSNAKYLNKIIETKGIVTSIESDSMIILNENINLRFNTKIQIKLNDSIKIKGRILGYDPLFEQINLDNCQRLN